MKIRTARAALAATLISCLSVGMVAADTRAASVQTLHITWFNWPPATALQQLGDQYGQEHPGIRIVVDAVNVNQWYSNNFNQFKKHKTSFAAAVLDSQWLGQAVKEGDILELTPWIRQNLNYRDYYPYLFAAYSQYPQRQPGETGSLDLRHGHFYGIPWQADAHGFAYRKDLFNDPTNQRDFLARYHHKLDVPQNMDQIVEIADFFTNRTKGLYGIAVHEQTGYDAAAETFNAWCWNYGGDIWNSATAQVEGYVNSPRCVHALDQLSHLTRLDSPPGASGDFIAEVTATMNQGKVAMIENWWGGMSGLLDPKASTLGKSVAEINSKIGYFNIPGETYQGVYSRYTPLGGMGLAVSAYAPSADQAAILAFAKWFQTPRIQTEWYQKGGSPTSRTVLNSPGFLAAAPYNAAESISYTFVKDFWNVPEFNQLLPVLTNNVNAAMNGKMTAKAALDGVAQTQASVLRATHNYPYYKNH